MRLQLVCVIVVELIFLLLVADVLHGSAAAPGVCPESKRRYPGDCRLFYRCVLLPAPTDPKSAAAATRRPGAVAHAHVWVPTRCTAGLVFNPKLKKCILPDEDWDCRNDDQIIPISKLPVSINQREPDEGVTEDTHLVTDKAEELNLVIPSLFDIGAKLDRVEEEPEIITEILDRKSSTTWRPHPYQAVPTASPYISVTNINNVDNDHIATQMNRIASLAHSLKAVAHTIAPIKVPYATLTGQVATPVTVTHTQIPRPSSLNLFINSRRPGIGRRPVPIQPQYELNLLPIQLNKITAHLMQTKQSALPTLHQQQQQTNLNFFGANVLKHIVEQSASLSPPTSIEQHNTERLVAALFNKYLANKSFVKIKNNNTVNAAASYSKLGTFATTRPPYPSLYQDNDIVTGIQHVPIALRLKQQQQNIVTAPLAAAASTSASNGNTFFPTVTPWPCVTGVRLPNATDCRRYYICNATTYAIHSYTCPPYTAFDKIRRMCDVTQYGQCVNPNGDEYNTDNTIDDKTADTNTNVQLVRVQLPPVEACNSRDKLPDPTSPRRYVLCIRTHDGRWTRHQMTCPGSLIFCPQRNLCSPRSSCY